MGYAALGFLLMFLSATALAARPAAGAAALDVNGGGKNNLVIENDEFLLNGQPFQIISGSLHFFRIHPDYWQDRLQRAKAMGINTVEVYTPWNMMEPYPGQYVWDGFADVERWMDLIQKEGLYVLLRPGPYICAEWDFGGFPWWFASSQVTGGRTMRLRTSDPVYLAHVDRWWSVLFPRLRKYMLENGGPILMVQMENEYGFCGDDKDYIRHLINTTRTHLSKTALLFTTDPPGVTAKGSIPGDEIYSAVDFGPGWFDPDAAFAAQAKMNEEGKSPPFCTEFYSGWLSHWSEPMANTSTEVLVKDTQILLEYANSTASLSFYMIHGGTNFGFWAGAGLDGDKYLPCITSYDYGSPISEAGDYCQPGIGGGCKMYVLRDLIAKHTGRTPPEVPPRPAIKRYGSVDLNQATPLMDSLDEISGQGIRTNEPDIMEEYGQRWGLILYRTQLPEGALDKEGKLDLGAPPHDFASVFLGGRLTGRLDRSQPGNTSLTLPAGGSSGHGSSSGMQLDILVEAMGRSNFGCEPSAWDFKGLTSKNITLNGKPLGSWEVFPLQLNDADVAGLRYSDDVAGPKLRHQEVADGTAGAGMVAAARRRMLQNAPVLASGAGANGSDVEAPAFFRGTFKIEEPALRGPSGFLADTYLDTRGWGKGIAWMNNFNLGWYWPSTGPQNTLYVPGPVLREGNNEIVLLELERAPRDASVVLDDAPDFYGPSGKPSAAQAVIPPPRRVRGAHLP